VCIPHITHQPTGGTVTPGATLPLTVVADIPTATYQWYVGTTGDTSTPIPGATAATFVAGSTSAKYWVRVSGPCGRSVDSVTVTVGACAAVTAAAPLVSDPDPDGSVWLSPGMYLANGDLVDWYYSPNFNVSQSQLLGRAMTINVATTALYWYRLTRGACTADSPAVQAPQ
jgi:hypothetical protein